jgi:uncharacterized phage protein (TIGR01671 family)
MNREIKFRAWHKQVEAMKPVEWMNFKGDLLKVPFYGNWAKSSCALMQYTGLKDKNGKEIYEGDLIRREDVGNYAKGGLSNLMEITFEDGSFCTRSGEFRTSLIEMEYPEYYEIVGNVYENPELLQEKPALT